MSPPVCLGNRATREAYARGLVSGFAPTLHSKTVLDRFEVLEMGKMDQVSKCHRLDWNCPSCVLRVGTGRDRGGFQSIRPVHPSKNRVICVREGARLQGFPDWFQFHRTMWHSFRMIGNSVSPYVGTAILALLAAKTGTQLLQHDDYMCSSANRG